MIAAATQSLAVNKVPFGWFDVALVVIVVFGLFRGRKNGMTKEVLPMFQWLSTVVVCGLGYEMVGQVFINSFRMGKLSSYVLGYLVLALLVFFLFLIISRLFKARLTGSNVFGGSEYYLGMLSGLVRYVSILFFALALINAPFYSSADILARQAYVKKNFGGGLYDGNYFPTLESIQEDIFKQSLTGPFIKQYAGVILINSVPPNTKKVEEKKTGTITIVQPTAK